MKITSLEIKDYPPIKNLKMEKLGDIVIIAGANGSGKTRLKDAIVQTLQGSPVLSMSIHATRPEEEGKKYFGARVLEVSQGTNNQILSNYINSRRYGLGKYVGSLVQIDSQRNIETIKYNQISYQVTDPDDQETDLNWGYQKFTDRWIGFMNYIHQKVAAHKNKLADEVQTNPTMVAEDILKKFPHPLEKYKTIFSQLLPGKELQDINPASPREFQYIDTTNSQILSFTSLSSGEQEVVKVIFDVARKDIKHSIIIVDEPELHLHPTLTFKLVETLKAIGDHTNQFIFLTHSADLISTYYSTGNVYFIDSIQTGSNQAHKLSELNHSHKEVVNLIGENLGLFAVGKKLIFVEGEESSIDRLTYNKIARGYLPEAKFVPIGSVKNLSALNIVEKQIRSAIFGIDIYMIRDRDGLSDEQILQIEENGRIKCLKKRHIENYFLDSEILLKVAEHFYVTVNKAEITREFIEIKLKEIAQNQLKLNLLQNTKEYLKLNHNFDIPTIRSIESKNLNEIKTEMVANVSVSLTNLSTGLSDLQNWMSSEQAKLEEDLQNENWKNTFQGKNTFSMICGELGIDKLKVRQAYVDIALKEKPKIFNDIKEILENFDN